MNTNAPAADRIPDGIEDLERLVLLLDHAGRQLMDNAAASQLLDRLPLQSFGLAVFIAQGQAAALLPEDHLIPEGVPAATGDLDGRRPVELLKAAEEITRSPSLRPEDLPGLSQLVVNLADLIREARGLDY